MGTKDLLESIEMGRELYCDELDLVGWKESFITDARLEPVEFKAGLSGMCKNSHVIVGDICIVKHPGKVYCEFYEFSNDAGHPDIEENKYVQSGFDSAIMDSEVRVLYVKTLVRRDLTLAIVETIDATVYLKFIIEADGLKQVRSKKQDFQRNINLFVDKYLSGKFLKEMIPDELINDSVIRVIFLKNPMDIQYINPKLLSDDHYKRVLYKDGGLLGLVPEVRRTLELCKIAIAEEPYAEKFVPERFKSLVNS